MTGNSKRPASTDAQPPQQKQDAPLPDITTPVPLKSIRISEIDKYITKPDNKTGIFEIPTLQLIESFYLQRLTAPFSQFQIRLAAAQMKHPEIAEFAVQNEAKFHTLPKTAETGREASRIMRLAESGDFDGYPRHRDALLYRVAIIQNYGVFILQPGHSAPKFEELLKISTAFTNVQDMLEAITAASERHLSRKEDRSCIWIEQGATSNIAADIVKMGGSQDEWVASQVDRLVQRFDDLPDMSTGLDEVDMVDAAVLLQLKGNHRLRKMAGGSKRDCFLGALMHGPQGTGKSEFVRAWCRHVRGYLITLDISAQGSLRGQSERLMRALFDKAIEIGQKDAVVIQMDEGEQILGKESSDHTTRSMQAYLKSCVSSVQASNSEVYFFVVSNVPEQIDLGDGWRRRLELRLHVKLPQQAGRVALLKHALKKCGSRVDNLEQVAELLEGYSAADINALIRIVERILSHHLFEEVKSWKEVAIGDETWVVEARQGKGMWEHSFDELPSEVQCRVRPAVITSEQLLDLIQKHRRDNGLPSVAEDEVRRHEIFASTMA